MLRLSCHISYHDMFLLLGRSDTIQTMTFKKAVAITSAFSLLAAPILFQTTTVKAKGSSYSKTHYVQSHPSHDSLAIHKDNDSDEEDRMFIERMISHHKMAIEMAKIELEKGDNEEVKLLAQKIIDSQSQEIETLSMWYEEWFLSEVKEDMSMMDMDKIEKLKTATDVDTEFMKMMIPHHKEAIKMARIEEKTTTRSELREMASKMVTEQKEEIKEMRTLLKINN
jgi:uncharacterized protein (DUF305 family)